MKDHRLSSSILVVTLLLASFTMLFQYQAFARSIQAVTVTPQVTVKPLKPAAITATAKAQIVAATRQAKAVGVTATARARSETIEMLADYLPANLKELKNYSDNHIGEKVFIAGRVFNIVPGDSNAFQIFPTGSTDGILIETSEPLVDLFEDEVVTVYGTVNGKYCFKNAQDNEVCQPHITAAFFYKRQIPEMQAARSTAQVIVAQATKEARIEQATAQAGQRATVQARVADYKTIATRELLTYPDNHTGELVRVAGKVFNVLGGEAILQMYPSGTSDAIYVKMEVPFDDVYEDDKIIVYGVVGGYECFTNQAGGEVCQPLIEEAFYSK